MFRQQRRYPFRVPPSERFLCWRILAERCRIFERAFLSWNVFLLLCLCLLSLICRPVPVPRLLPANNCSAHQTISLPVAEGNEWRTASFACPICLLFNKGVAQQFRYCIAQRCVSRQHALHEIPALERSIRISDAARHSPYRAVSIPPARAFPPC